ncbi:uncharacterized protein PV07_10063 [Cladophialophora immunda]|uniref:Extracellular membrane protein CFEM domain-containing protein n=1 Tax=Cladophialophora immunda TaxID=569365 RepID=A0A0D2CL91_9EURO|nr:uncharacterized protein PV07_10063 [Cladophialophora immunda]KIW24344.1 hypothetical protein PV07_10063 [Cladophialophora immunda]
MRYFTLILSLSALAAASSSLGSNFTSTDCASSSGFDKCFSAAQNKATKCIDDGDGSDAIDIACTCVMWLDEINCAVSNCWNEVYSCQYQALIIRYMTFCPTSQDGFPFFPAPDNAPGGCSCNIGQVYLNAANSYTESTKCSSPSSVDGEIACICCMEASAYSSIYNICPDTDPSLIGLGTIETQLEAFDQPFDQCGPYLDQYDCIADLGYAPIGSPTSTLVNPTNMPANGTQTLYTTGAQITTPLSGSVVTWSHASSEFTATMANLDAERTADGSTTTTGASTAGSSTSSATGASSTGGASQVRDALGWHRWGLLMLGAFVCEMLL